MASSSASWLSGLRGSALHAQTERGTHRGHGAVSRLGPTDGGLVWRQRTPSRCAAVRAAGSGWAHLMMAAAVCPLLLVAATSAPAATCGQAGQCLRPAPSTCGLAGRQSACVSLPGAAGCSMGTRLPHPGHCLPWSATCRRQRKATSAVNAAAATAAFPCAPCPPRRRPTLTSMRAMLPLP